MKIPYKYVFLFGSTPEFAEVFAAAADDFETLNILAPAMDAAGTILEHVPIGTVVAGDLTTLIAEDLRRHFNPAILGQCVLHDWLEHGDQDLGAILHNGTADDYEVFAAKGDPCLAIHLIGFGSMPWCHNIWVPVPENKKRLDFIQREIEILLNPRKAQVQ